MKHQPFPAENKPQKALLLKKYLDDAPVISLSPLVIQLIEYAADDQSSANELADIIEKDAGLTARLLKMAGSAYFSRPKPITSISHAVVLLGLKRVRFMALALSLRDTFPMGKEKHFDFDSFWKASVYRALIAKEFAHAAKLEVIDPDEAFMSGLVLEIGLLMLHANIDHASYPDFPGIPSSMETILVWEEKYFGINFKDAGSYLMKDWHLSDNLLETQQFYGPAAFDSNRSVLCKVVELSRLAAELVFTPGDTFHDLHQLAQKHLKLEPDITDGILSMTFDKVESIAEQLRLTINAQTDMLSVLEKANQALVRINASIDASLQQFSDGDDLRRSALYRDVESRNATHEDVLQNTLDAVVHEIRNPLTAIGGFAKRLAVNADEGNRGRLYAKIISEESARLEQVLRDITEYAQSYHPNLKPVDLVEFIEDVVSEFADLLKKKEIQIISSYPPESVPVHLDTKGMVRILRQLLENAIERIGKKKGVLSVRVKPIQSPEHVYVGISDSGPPIPNAIKDALLDANLSTKTFGVGLGIPFIKKMITAHGGQMRIKRIKNKGNTVCFTLPRFSNPEH